VEQAAMFGGNLALAALLAARWVESGHFPLSNMYESLLFLAWGITVGLCTLNQVDP
jgi:ABC-type transport system involved in cytochrome c biogenesis permease subunit